MTSGVAGAPSLNPNLAKRKKKALSAEALVQGILEGDRLLLSRAITLVESTKPSDQATAREVVERCLTHAGNAARIGITGVPGVGKSAFIEALGSSLTAQGHRLAVLAIDPSSERTGGSILGDKTRMETLSVDPNAFIRPSPSGGSLGGVARKTRETIYLCEAAGFDVVFVETVGVGQSETAVQAMVDFFLLLVLAGAGDELQGIKRGIVEMADGIAITKADGDNVKAAQLARGHYRHALHLYPPRPSGWKPHVHLCSALTGAGIENVWRDMEAFFAFTRANGSFEQHRQAQARYWMMETIRDALETGFFAHPDVRNALPEIEKAVQQGSISSYAAAQHLIEMYTRAPNSV